MGWKPVSCCLHPHKLKPRTTSLQSARIQSPWVIASDKPMASAAEARGYNKFDTMRSPKYQGHGCCHSFQRSLVDYHGHIPSLTMISSFDPTTGISERHTTDLICRNSANKQCEICVPQLTWPHDLFRGRPAPCWNDFARLKTSPNRRRDELQALISWHVPHSRSHLPIALSKFTERHKVHALDERSLPDGHGPISCLHDLSTHQCRKVKRFPGLSRSRFFLNSAVLVWTLLHVSWHFGCYLVTIRKKMMSN